MESVFPHLSLSLSFSLLLGPQRLVEDEEAAGQETIKVTSSFSSSFFPSLKWFPLKLFGQLNSGSVIGRNAWCQNKDRLAQTHSRESGGASLGGASFVFNTALVWKQTRCFNRAHLRSRKMWIKWLFNSETRCMLSVPVNSHYCWLHPSSGVFIFILLCPALLLSDSGWLRKVSPSWHF